MISPLAEELKSDFDRRELAVVDESAQLLGRRPAAPTANERLPRPRYRPSDEEAKASVSDVVAQYRAETRGDRRGLRFVLALMLAFCAGSIVTVAVMSLGHSRSTSVSSTTVPQATVVEPSQVPTTVNYSPAAVSHPTVIPIAGPVRVREAPLLSSETIRFMKSQESLVCKQVGDVATNDGYKSSFWYRVSDGWVSDAVVRTQDAGSLSTCGQTPSTAR
jgi:hypothetical protein